MKTRSFSLRAATLRNGSSRRMEPDSLGTNSYAFCRIWRRTRSRSMSLLRLSPALWRSRKRSNCGISSEWNWIIRRVPRRLYGWASGLRRGERLRTSEEAAAKQERRGIPAQRLTLHSSRPIRSLLGRECFDFERDAVIRLVAVEAMQTVLHVLAQVAEEKARHAEPAHLVDVHPLVTQHPLAGLALHAGRNPDAAPESDGDDVAEEERPKPPRITVPDDGSAIGHGRIDHMGDKTSRPCLTIRAHAQARDRRVALSCHVCLRPARFQQGRDQSREGGRERLHADGLRRQHRGVRRRRRHRDH